MSLWWTMMLTAALAGEDSAAGVTGFVEVRGQAHAGVQGIPLFAVERLRPTFSAEMGERVVFTTTLEAALSQGWRASEQAFKLLDEANVDSSLLGGLQRTEHENEVFAISGAHHYLSVDRLALELYLPAMDVRIGRQALNWGSGFAVNPSDPFPEFLLDQPWKPRSGVNAVRADIPFGNMHSVQLVAAADDTFKHPRLAARLTLNALNADWSVVGAWREEVDGGIVGVDIKGTLGVGYWFEGVVHLQKDAKAYEELAAGVDYSFPVLEQMILTAQYYRNGSGQTDGLGLALAEEPKPFAPAFRGRDYLMSSLSLGVVPELSGSMLWIQNLNDGTAYLVPSVMTFPTESLELSFVVQVPVAVTGNPGEFSPDPDDLRLSVPTTDGALTELDLNGLVPDATFTLWARWNF